MAVSLELFRLGTAACPVWDGAGAAAQGGRWNPPAAPVIYAAGALSLAMLERLVQRRNLGHTLCVVAEVPDDLAIEDLMGRPPPNWRALGSPEAAAAGGDWIASGRTPLLRVPSALVPREANYLVNPSHPDARRIRVSSPEKLEWDVRLFGVLEARFALRSDPRLRSRVAYLALEPWTIGPDFEIFVAMRRSLGAP